MELLRLGTSLSGGGSYVRVLLCVSCVPASCVHIWFVSCPCFMSLWVKYVPAVFVSLCVNYPVYISPVFWVWFGLVYSLFPSVSVHVSPALSCLDVYIKYYYLSLSPRLRVPVPPSCVHRDRSVTQLFEVNLFVSPQTCRAVNSVDRRRLDKHGALCRVSGRSWESSGERSRTHTHTHTHTRSCGYNEPLELTQTRTSLHNDKNKANATDTKHTLKSPQSHTFCPISDYKRQKHSSAVRACE